MATGLMTAWTAPTKRGWPSTKRNSWTPSAASAATTLYIPKLTYSKGKDAWGLFDFKTIVEPPAYLSDENQKKARAEFDAAYAKNEAEAKAAGFPSLEAKAVGVAKAKALEKEKADAAAAAAKK